MRANLLSAALFCAASTSANPAPHQSINGISDVRTPAYAIAAKRIHVAPERVLEDATILVRDGRIVSVGRRLGIPDDAIELDYSAREIYAAFVELDSGYGLPAPAPRAPFAFGKAETLESRRKGPFAVNQAIRADYRAAETVSHNEKAAKTLRKNGFAAVLAHQADGIARGTSALVLLNDADIRESVLIADAATHYSFNKGSSPQSFPISVLGSAALLRQTESDAQWYRHATAPDVTDLALEAWNRHLTLPRIFSANHWQDIPVIARISEEFGYPVIVRGAGDSYRRAASLAKLVEAFIVPLTFPEATLLDDPLSAGDTPLSELMHWEQAPTNPSALIRAGARVAITSANSEKQFLPRLRKAVGAGLAPSDALAALTSVPAALIDRSDDLGELRPGMLANLVVTNGDLFEKPTKILETWVAGERFAHGASKPDARGQYQLAVGEFEAMEVEIAGTRNKPALKLLTDDKSGTKPKRGGPRMTLDGDYVTLGLVHPRAGPLQLSGWKDADGTWSGRARQTGSSSWLNWSMTRSDGAASPKEDKKAKDEPTERGAIPYPFVAYGNPDQPVAESVVFRDVTAWTNEAAGVVMDVDLRIADGEIVAIGKDLPARGAREIDASGLHLTPGIIDEHAHIALRAVNDIATNSAMVRMRDAINSESIDIYRNLAGGVTSAQLLHGSANPIGGQSAIVKLRWGALPEEMLFAEAEGFIKFALGENVKRSSNPASIRYPQTRMGVESFLTDQFTQARKYAARRDRWQKLSGRRRAKEIAFRRNLALEPLAEILAGERHISAHSYVQSEITMLMDVARRFDFKVNTFTHILEGYKVADAMAEHGAGASTFSDWWNYKWEVRYAIPYNAALMHGAGINVAINSDSAEMSRRLNQEAAKTVKYGGMTEEEALKTITLNPAKLLRIDDHVGSLRVGKDADVVLWDTHPLSVEAKPLMTLVDGIVYFDRERDKQARKRIEAERSRLIQSMARDPQAKPKTAKSAAPPSRQFHCDSLTGFEFLNEEVL